MEYVAAERTVSIFSEYGILGLMLLTILVIVIAGAVLTWTIIKSFNQTNKTNKDMLSRQLQIMELYSSEKAKTSDRTIDALINNNEYSKQISEALLGLQRSQDEHAKTADERSKVNIENFRTIITSQENSESITLGIAEILGAIAKDSSATSTEIKKLNTSVATINPEIQKMALELKRDLTVTAEELKVRIDDIKSKMNKMECEYDGNNSD